MPWGTWVEDEKMKMVGRYTTLLLCRETFEAQCVGLLTRSGIMSGEEAQRACAEAADEVRDVSKGLHAYNVQ